VAGGVGGSAVATVPVTTGETIADGLAGSIEEGSVTVEIARRHHLEMVTVTEVELAAAVRFLALEVGLVVEGAGAAATAALRSGAVAPESGTTVVLVTGRNIDPGPLASILELEQPGARGRSS
jgi:threonine dehydratase